MKVTISPTVARSCRCSQVPSAKIAISVMVELAPESTVSSAHQLSTRNCAAISRSMALRSLRVSSASLTKLWISVTLPSASPACSASAEWWASTRACAPCVWRNTNQVSTAIAPSRRITRPVSRQFRNSVSGRSTKSATKVARFSRRNDSQTPNSVSAPCHMILSWRPEWVPPWKACGSRRTCSKYRLMAASRRRCASRSACSATRMPAPMLPTPIRPHRPSRSRVCCQVSERGRAPLLASVSTMLPNSRAKKAGRGENRIGQDQRDRQVPLRGEQADHAAVESQDAHLKTKVRPRHRSHHRASVNCLPMS
jgi:hypothetical protein